MKKKSKRWIGMEAKHEQNQTLNKIPPERQVMIGRLRKGQARHPFMLLCQCDGIKDRADGLTPYPD